MSLYPEWQKEHPPQPPKARQLATMHAAHGQTPGRTCGECRFLYHVQPGQNIYNKCKKARRTRGPGTDWRHKWQACGMFEEKKQ